MAPDMDAFADFVMNRVLRFPGVKDVNSSFVLQTVKPPSVLPLTHLKMVDAAARTG
jgi:Lrp/AsnC family leucine-responsive transcriptional regulator